MTASSCSLIYRISWEVIFMLHSSSPVHEPHPLSFCAAGEIAICGAALTPCMFYALDFINTGRWWESSAILSWSHRDRKSSEKGTQTRTSRRWGQVKRHVTQEFLAALNNLDWTQHLSDGVGKEESSWVQEKHGSLLQGGWWCRGSRSCIMNQQCCHLRLSCRSLDVDKLVRKAHAVKSDSGIADFYTL